MRNHHAEGIPNIQIIKWKFLISLIDIEDFPVKLY